MKKVLFFFLICVLTMLLTTACEKLRNEIVPPEPDPAIVSAFTSGAIPRESPIRARFTKDMVDPGLVDIELEQSPFSFSPKIKGKAVWTSERVLEFRPSRSLTPGQDYTATVQLAKAIETGEIFKRFGFRFSVIKQSFSVHVDGLKIPDNAEDPNPELHGSIETADVVKSGDIEKGILNDSEKRLKEGVRSRLVFAAKEPAVRIPGKGVILPASQGLTIPIETVNLKGVVVEATRIYEDNITKFLQVNALEGDNELKRVGEAVWKGTLPIEWFPEKVNQWVRTGLDLTRLAAEYPKGMYRLKVYFTKDHIVYNCPDYEDEQHDDVHPAREDEQEEISGWDYWDWEYNRPGYYDNRENPCHPGCYIKFYDHDIAAYRNVLISDIGLIAKKGDPDTMFITAVSIKTAQPLAYSPGQKPGYSY